MICTITCALIAVIVIVLVSVLAVVLPRIAQNTVDGTTVGIEGLAVYQVDDDHFHISVNTSIANPASLGGTLQETTIRMYCESETGENYLMGEMPLPATEIPAEGNVSIHAETIMKLTPELRSGVQKFLGQSLLAQFLNVTLKGSISMKSFGITFSDLDFDKTLLIEGMDSLDVTVRHLTITGPDPFPYTGIVNYHNPSNLEILMGDLYMKTSFAGQPSGVALMKDVYIGKGLSTAPVSGHLQETFAHSATLVGPPVGILLCQFIPNGTIYSNINKGLNGIKINATLYAD